VYISLAITVLRDGGGRQRGERKEGGREVVEPQTNPERECEN